jgi:hypothetical protein
MAVGFSQKTLQLLIRKRVCMCVYVCVHYVVYHTLFSNSQKNTLSQTLGMYIILNFKELFFGYGYFILPLLYYLVIRRH